MNFLSSLYDTVKGVYKDTVSNVGNTISNIGNLASSAYNTVKNAFGNTSSATASAIDALNSGQTGLSSSGNYGLDKSPNMTINTAGMSPVGKDALGNSIYNINGTPTAINNYGQVSPTGNTLANSGYLTNQGNAQYSYPNYTPLAGSTSNQNISPYSYASIQNPSNYQVSANQLYSSSWQPKVDQYGRASTASVGDVYQDKFGNTITPIQGFSGLQGSGQSFSSLMPPSQGQSGSAGGGGSNFTGTLSGTSGLGVPAIPGQTQDDKTIQDQKKNQKVLNIPSDFNIPGLTFLNGPLSVSSMPPAPIPTQPISGTQNLNNISATKKSTSGIVNLPQNNVNDRQTTIAKANNDYQTNLAAETAKNTIPQNPISYTQDQASAINSSNDPFGLRNAIDQYKSTQTNLTQFETNRVNLLNNINSANQTYQRIFDDIKADPNIPKGLAAKRLAEQAKIQKPIVDGLIGQLQIVQQQIEDANNQVNRQFQIVQNAQNQQDKQKQQALDFLKFYNDTGAIAAFSSNDVQRASEITGIPTSIINNMVKNAVNPNVKTSIEGSDASGRYLVTYNTKTGDLISKKTISPSVSQNIPSPYVQSNPQAQSILSQANTLANNISVKNQKETFLANVKNAINSGDLEGAQNQIRTLAYNKLNASQKSDFDTYQSAIQSATYASDLINNGAVNFGPYKSALEFLKPLVGQSKDQNYVTARQAIELSQAQIRKGYYGTAVTNTEAQNANQFLISNNDDAQTVATKLAGYSNFLKWVNDATIARTIGATAPSLQSYISNNPQSSQRNQSNNKDPLGLFK